MNAARQMVFIVSLVLSTLLAWAQTSASDIEALRSRVAAYESAILQGDMQGITDVFPKKISDYAKTTYSMSEAQFNALAAEAYQLSYKFTKIVEFDIDVVSPTASRLPNGTAYFLLPTKLHLDYDQGGQGIITYETLAFLDEGQWALLDTSNPDGLLGLYAVYPEYESVGLRNRKQQYIED
jgi:hypothetical protein